MNDMHESPDSSPTRIVVVGGGIAGAEAALTLAIGLPDADVTLVGASPRVALLPDLVYHPFGVHVAEHGLDLAQLHPHGVRTIEAHAEHVDVRARVLETSAGDVPFDVLVAAPGAEPVDSALSLRSFADAERIGTQLRSIEEAARGGERRTITLRAMSEDSWTAPACEFALLVGSWFRAQRLDARVETLLATADSDAFEWFGPVGEATVEQALRRSRVKIATGIPAGRFDQLDGDLVVEFGSLHARELPGLPGLGSDGWYDAPSNFEVAPKIFVIGDAIRLPYRAGFATSWQARQVLLALDGDIGLLGATIDGIPTNAVEYQMDLADGVMRARMTNADRLAHPFLGHDADIEVVAGARPDKLAGLLLHERILQRRDGEHDAPLAFRDRLREHTKD